MRKGERALGKDAQRRQECTMPHGLTLQERNRLTLSGIRDVMNFDEGQVLLKTDIGSLTIKGSELHVDQLSLESGDLSLAGRIDSLEYDDDTGTGGLFGRLFR